MENAWVTTAVEVTALLNTVLRLSLMSVSPSDLGRLTPAALFMRTKGQMVRPWLVMSRKTWRTILTIEFAVLLLNVLYGVEDAIVHFYVNLDKVKCGFQAKLAELLNRVLSGLHRAATDDECC